MYFFYVCIHNFFLQKGIIPFKFSTRGVMADLHAVDEAGASKMVWPPDISPSLHQGADYLHVA